MNLPPGWRLLALFGADWVAGDWLSAWTLLDLFLLLIFSLAVFKLWGLRAGLVALLAFGLAYQEPWAPRLVWFFLLYLGVVAGRALRDHAQVARRLALAGDGGVTAWLIPFIATWLQVLYPLEAQGQSCAHPCFGGKR